MAYSIRQNPASNNNFTEGRLGTAIDQIYIHHAATTDFEGIGRTFKNPARQASAHYGVGQNNNVDQYVQEGDIAWHCGNWPYNKRSIGIENVNAGGADQGWPVADSTFNTLVELVRDIATRHKLMPVVVGKNLFGHKDVYQTACPASLYPRLQQLADAVNSGVAPAPAPAPPSSNSATDQVLTIGSYIQFDPSYRVDALAFIGGLWQIQTNALCPKGFSWNDNGIPADPVTEVAGGAGNPKDQVLQVGSMYRIPGKYRVQNLGVYQDRWLAQINIKGWSLWVDVETVTEVAA